MNPKKTGRIIDNEKLPTLKGATITKLISHFINFTWQNDNTSSPNKLQHELEL